MSDEEAYYVPGGFILHYRGINKKGDFVVESRFDPVTVNYHFNPANCTPFLRKHIPIWIQRACDQLNYYYDFEMISYAGETDRPPEMNPHTDPDWDLDKYVIHGTTGAEMSTMTGSTRTRGFAYNWPKTFNPDEGTVIGDTEILINRNINTELEGEKVVLHELAGHSRFYLRHIPFRSILRALEPKEKWWYQTTLQWADLHAMNHKIAIPGFPDNNSPVGYRWDKRWMAAPGYSLYLPYELIPITVMGVEKLVPHSLHCKLEIENGKVGWKLEHLKEVRHD